MAAGADPLQALAGVEPFAGVGADVLAELDGTVRWRALAAGEALLADDVAEMAVVIDGDLIVVVRAADGTATEVARLGPGSVVGEIALLFGGRRTASVLADGAAQVIGLTAEGLARLVAAAPRLLPELVERAAERLHRAQLTSALLGLLGPVPPDDLASLLAAAETVVVRSGEVLREGGDAALVVLAGRLRLPDPDAEVAAGDVVGGARLLGDAAPPAELTAVRDSLLARVRRADFDALADRHPTSVRHLARSELRRAREAAPPRGERHRTIAVLAADDDVDLRLLATPLVAALASHGPTFHGWSARMDSLLHAPGAAQSEPGSAGDARLSHWLREAEAEHRFVVHELDRSWTPWSRRVCRQADDVVLVARADGEARAGPLEREVDRLLDGRGAPTRSLVLLHEPGVDGPVDAARWLDGRQVDRHLHVRAGEAGMARLARMLAGAPTGLVLSGGGARGLAHLGVIRALRGSGVELDLTGGTSIGGILAAVAAMEWPDEELIPRMATAFTGLLDYTLPIVSLLRGERISRVIEASSEDRDIEDLWLPFFCISTNLTRAREVVHRRGRLATALRASVAIPGVLPPVAVDGDLLIDGGTLNNLPVDHMRQSIPAGTVISVDVTPPRGPRAKGATPTALSGWGQATAMVVPGRRPVGLPGIGTTMLGATIVAAMRDRNSHVEGGLADLHLTIDARGHGLLDFEALEAIAQAGYEAAMPQIGAWLEARRETT